MSEMTDTLEIVSSDVFFFSFSFCGIDSSDSFRHFFPAER
jgi:hypothetical protein